MTHSIIEVIAPPGYLRTFEVANRFGVTSGTVCRWVRDQRLRGRIFHGVYLVEETSFKEFLNKGYTKRGRRKPWSWVENALKEIFPEGLDFL